MAVIQYVAMSGRLLGKPIEASRFVRSPSVGEIVWARQQEIGAPTRMIVRGAEHVSVKQAGVQVPALALFVEPYADTTGHVLPDMEGLDTEVDN